MQNMKQVFINSGKVESVVRSEKFGVCAARGTLTATFLDTVWCSNKPSHVVGVSSSP